MHNSGYFPPPVFNFPPPGPTIRPPVFNWRPPAPGTFCPENASWWQPPPGPWGFNSAGNEYNAPGYQSAVCQPRRTHGQYHNFGRNRGGSESGPNRNGCAKQKRKKEPVFAYFCDTCDRGFKDQQKYDIHVGQHVKCSVTDCSFTAHEKLVSLHWRNNHAPGAKRIKLDTPEEIAKWREERRKNYPTMSNVVKKMKVMEEKEERGEVLGTAQFGKMRRGHMASGGRRGFERSNRVFLGDEEALTREAAPKQTLGDQDPLGVLAQSDSDSDKDSAADGKKEGLTVTPRHMTSGLGSLLASYGSASDSDSEHEPVAMPILKASEAIEENRALMRSLPTSVLSPAPQPGAVKYPNSRGSHSQARPQSARPHATSCRPGRGKNVFAPRRTTLLEMLLAPEIRHERNVVLQCVRYIVRHSLFGVEGQHPEGGASEGTTTGAEDQLPVALGYPRAHGNVIGGTRHGGGACEGGGQGLKGRDVMAGKEPIEERWRSPQVQNAVMGVKHPDRHTDRHPTDVSTDLGETVDPPTENTVVIPHCLPEDACRQLGNAQSSSCESLGEGPESIDTPPSGKNAASVDTPPAGESAVSVDMPPVVDTPPAGGSAVIVDVPPVVDTLPAEERAASVATPPAGENAVSVDTPLVRESAFSVDMPPVVDTPLAEERTESVDSPPVLNRPLGERAVSVDTLPVVNTPHVGESAVNVDMPPLVDTPHVGESSVSVDTPLAREAGVVVDMPRAEGSSLGVDTPPVVDMRTVGESSVSVDTPSVDRPTVEDMAPVGEGPVCSVDSPLTESGLPTACPQDDEQSSGTWAAVIGGHSSFALDTDESQKLSKCDGSPAAHTTGPHERHSTTESSVIGGEHYLPKEDSVIGGLAEHVLGSEQPSCSVVDDEIWEIPAAYLQSQ